jgi:N6-L-threonylcarbamoyladenine synthase
VSRVLGLGYPGGPVIERVAKHGESPVAFPRAWLRGTDDFSFSGLKTAVIRKAEELGLTSKGILEEFNPNKPEPMLANVAAGFQEAVVDALVQKTAHAANREGVKQVILSGGVAANKALRTAMEQNSPVVTSCPPPIFCTDNAAMIAACGYRQLVRGDQSYWHMEVYPNLRMVQQ